VNFATGRSINDTLYSIRRCAFDVTASAASAQVTTQALLAWYARLGVAEYPRQLSAKWRLHTLAKAPTQIDGILAVVVLLIKRRWVVLV